MDRLFARSSWVTVLLLAALFAGFCFHESASVAFPYVNLDEQGHLSYSMRLARSEAWFPPLQEMPLYDFVQMRWSGEANFINHPPLAYHFLNLFSGFDPPGLHSRYASIAFFALGFAAILAALHKTGMFSSLGLAAAAMFCVLLKLQRFGETFSNDSIAFLGGGLAFLGIVLLWRRPLTGPKPGAALLIAGLGLALCVAAKLNAALLVGVFTLASLTLFARQNRAASAQLSKPLLAMLVLLCAVLALPYVRFAFEFGSPAPSTPGQIKMLAESLDGPRLGFAAYLFESFKGALENAGPDAVFTYGIFAAVTAFAALKFSFGQARAGAAMNLQPVARATLVATLLTLGLHLAFSYQRHLQYGWQPELYPRYYFPLLGPYLLLFFAALARLGPFRAFAPKTAA